MANVTYAWNPFQERIDCRVPKETVKTSAQKDRKEFVPRAAPFFSRNFELYKKGDPTPLVMGTDYVFAHSFDLFIGKYSRNVFGSVVLIGDKYKDDELYANYDTVGGPFTLNDAAFVELVGKIVNTPRQVDWSGLDGVTIPSAFPADPHEQPMAQVYDFFEMMVALKSFVLAITQAQQDTSQTSLLEEHLKAPLEKAHKATASDLGLSLVENLGTATINDLNGNSANLHVTVEVLKEAFRLQAQNKLPLS